MTTHLKSISGQDVDAKQLIMDFALEIIASCGFGIEANSFSKREDNIIKEMALTLAGQRKPSLSGIFRILTILSFPSVSF